MHISVWLHDSNPTIDRRSFRRSRHYCETEVAAGRAQPLDSADIRQGIQLLAPQTRPQRTERRGSPEARGCLTANESQLNSDYRGPQTQIVWLAREYEDRLLQHQATDWRPGKPETPRVCAVIAARVKTILTKPTLCPA